MEDQMGKEIASKVGFFISVDKSYYMLNNSKEKREILTFEGSFPVSYTHLTLPTNREV